MVQRYIHRACRAVALSVWKSKYFLSSKTAGLAFSEFLRAKLDWFCTPGKKNRERYNIIEHWQKHVETWLHNKPGNIQLVRFEELVLNTEKTLKSISDEFGLDFLDGVKKVDGLVGFSPNKGKIDEWKKY